MRLFVADRQKLHVGLNLPPQAVTPQNGAKRTDLEIGGLRRCARALPQFRDVSTSDSRLRGHGACSSTRAQQALRAAGFKRVLNIREGMLGSRYGRGWLKNGLPLER